MKLELNRIAKKPSYTIGQLFVDGEYFCDTLEDRCRDLDKEEKVMGDPGRNLRGYRERVREI